jgi:thiol-disulfide isomerase/thioredoxin
MAPMTEPHRILALLVCLAGCAATVKQPEPPVAAPVTPPVAKLAPEPVMEKLDEPQPKLAATPAVLVSPRKSEGPVWRGRQVRLAELGLRDLGGRVWKLHDLDGKVALVNVWATWCGPCKKELPYVQKLHDSLKGRSDTIVISLNVDEDPESARLYAAEHQLTFPVLPASNYVRETLGKLSVPRSWIVGDGMLTAESFGFRDGHGDAWLEGALAQIEQARAKLQ